MRTLALAVLTCTLAMSVDGRPVNGQTEPPTARLFDTGRPLGGPLTEAVIRAKRGWLEAGTAGPLRGDACIENGRLIACVKRSSGTVELYYELGGRIEPAAVLSFCGPDAKPGSRIQSLSVLRNTEERTSLNVEIGLVSGEDMSVGLSVKAGQPSIEILPGDRASAVLLRHSCAYVSMPDVSAHGLLFEAQTTEGRHLYLPGDNLFLLHLLGGGDAMLVCNWLERDQEIPVAVRERGGKKWFTATRIGCAKQQKLGVSVIAGKAIWHAVNSADLNLYEDKKVDWTLPFEAAWRIDYRRADGRSDGLVDSLWSLHKRKDKYRTAIKLPNPMYQIPRVGVQNHKTRQAVTYGLGTGIYPLYFAEDGSTFMRLGKFRYGKREYKDSIPIYPVLRGDRTPQGVVVPSDVLRNAYGPKYLTVLDIEMLASRHPRTLYPGTCGVTAEVKSFFSDGTEKENREKIKKRVGLMNIFVRNVRTRIEDYLEWADEMASFYEAEKERHPELRALAKQFEDATLRIPSRYKHGRERIKTPEYAASLSQKLVDLVDSDAEDKLEQCDQLGRQIRTIGGGQDGMLESFRANVMRMRQRAGVLAATSEDPANRAFARRMRARTWTILRFRWF